MTALSRADTLARKSARVVKYGDAHARIGGAR